jgi:hypothetical protein
MNNLLKLIICPISKKIFKTPVIGSDGVVYEAELAFKLLESKCPSPITGQLLDEDIKVVITLKSFINLLIKKFNKLKDLRYKSNFDITKIYHFSKIEILSIFTEKKNYKNLLKYDMFKIEDLELYTFADFLRYAPDNVVIHFINKCNSLNYEFEVENSKWSILNILLKHGKDETVKKVLRKSYNFDYEHKCKDDWQPIHQVANNYDGECTRLLIDKGVNLFAKTSENITGLEYVVGNHDVDTIKYVLSKVDHLIDLQLMFLIIRLDDNEKIDAENKIDLKSIMICKYS